MRRRQFIAGLGSVAAWPLAARAQQAAKPVIGYLRSPKADAEILGAFRQGLSETGFVEGRNVAIEYRLTDEYDRLQALAADLVRRKVDVIAADSGAAAPVAKAATTTIPIVFFTTGDPVALGFVASLSRPGGNLTGVTFISGSLGPKRLELMRELVPKAALIAFLMNSTNPSTVTQMSDIQAVAGAIGQQIQVFYASSESEIDSAFATLAKFQAGALVVGSDAFLASRRGANLWGGQSYGCPVAGFFGGCGQMASRRGAYLRFRL